MNNKWWWVGLVIILALAFWVHSQIDLDVPHGQHTPSVEGWFEFSLLMLFLYIVVGIVMWVLTWFDND